MQFHFSTTYTESMVAEVYVEITAEKTATMTKVFLWLLSVFDTALHVIFETVSQTVALISDNVLPNDTNQSRF